MSAPPTLAQLKAILEAFNSHDLDRVMSYFAADCVLEMPRGPDPWGRRSVGATEVRAALRSRFYGIPDVHYGEDEHAVAGDLGVSRWRLTGTMAATGAAVDVRGCDLFEFRDGLVTRKDSYWKIVEPASPG